MILYFSGTGNSKYCAQQIASAMDRELVSINEMMKRKATELDVRETSILGFVCPTYDFDMAYAVAEFLDQLRIDGMKEDCYVFAVFTCGKSCGTAEQTMRKILDKKGIPLHAAYKVAMPDNYIPMFPLASKEEQQSILAKAEESIAEIIKQIAEREHATVETAKAPAPMKFIIEKVAIPKQRKATQNFWITDACVGCGLCESVCPKNIIEMRDGKPVWTTDDCACCLGCIHRCPTKAIQYGKKTQKTGRYTNPNVTL